MRILTQSTPEGGRSRLPWVVAGIVTLLFGVVAAFGTVQVDPEPLIARTVIEHLALPKDPEAGAGVLFREERFERGDTISALLERLEVDDQEASLLLRSPNATLPFRWLRPGSTVQAKTGEDGSLLPGWASLRARAGRCVSLRPGDETEGDSAKVDGARLRGLDGSHGRGHRGRDAHDAGQQVAGPGGHDAHGHPGPSQRGGDLAQRPVAADTHHGGCALADGGLDRRTSLRLQGCLDEVGWSAVTSSQGSAQLAEQLGPVALLAHP